MILAIDPGLRACGCALFYPDGPLERAALVKNTERSGRGPAAAIDMAIAVATWLRIRPCVVTTLVLEYPRVYPGMRDNDPNDLIELACVDGALGAWITTCDVTHYYPSEWKGQVPANPCARRIVKSLSLGERARVENLDSFLSALEKAEAKGRDVSHSAHNTLDAVGIGLKYLGLF